MVPRSTGYVRFHRIQYRAQRHRPIEVKLNFLADVRQIAQMVGQFDADHGSV